MAAHSCPKDPSIYFPYKLTAFEEAQIGMQFDLSCDMDAKEIESIKREIKFLKKVCIYKILLSPLEYTLTFIFFGKQETKYKKEITSLYWRFFRNKITIEKFSKEILELVKTGKVL